MLLLVVFSEVALRTVRTERASHARAVVEQCQLALRALGDLEADLSGGRLMKKQ